MSELAAATSGGFTGYGVFDRDESDILAWYIATLNNKKIYIFLSSNDLHIGDFVDYGYFYNQYSQFKYIYRISSVLSRPIHDLYYSSLNIESNFNFNGWYNVTLTHSYKKDLGSFTDLQDAGEAAYQDYITPDNPTMDLDIYTQGNFNPLITFKWSNLQNPREGVDYFVLINVLNRLEGDRQVYVPITDYIPFENETTTFSYNEIALQAKDLDEIWLKTYLCHKDSGGLWIVDQEIEDRIFDDGTTTSEYTNIHVGESPEIDDEYTEEDSEFLDTPSRPSVPTLDNIMTSSYVVNETELNQVKTFLWSEDYKKNVFLLNNSPIENIISLKTLPFDVRGTATTISIGNVPTTISALKAESSTHTFSLRPVLVSKKYNSFLDYEPYTSVSVNLPFCGVYDLPTNLVMGKYLKIDYAFDILTGACCAMLSIGNANTQTPFDYVMGNCGIDIPVSAQNRTEVEIAQQRARISGTANAIGGAMGTIGNLLSGNFRGAIESAVSGGVSAYNSYLDYATASYHTTTKGSIGSQLINYVPNTAYLIYDRPIYSKPSTYAHDKGYPCELKHTLSNLNGFTAVGHTVELNIPCTETERAVLRNLLISGVYLNWNKPIPAHNITNNNVAVFYKNESDNLHVSKTITEMFRLENIKWKEDTDSFNPVITFRKRKNKRTFNYAALQLNDVVKYYYVKRETLCLGGIVEVELECDVLMTYNSYIKGITTIVARQEEKNNPYIVDNQIALPVNREMSFKEIDNVGSPNGSIVLTVVNG